MGIPGILKEIGKGERIALAKLAVEHLERTQRPLRVAIDAAIWNFQTQAGQGGKNPALRTLYYKLLRLLALPIHPLFVYDGRNKPLIKRGRAVSRWGTCTANETSKKLIQHFKYPCHVAPGEAEAECALLQKRGIVDMVMSQDGDAIMFGSQLTLRDWSKEGTRGNKAPTHVNLLDLPRLKERSGLDPDGMILVALLSGGDYDQDGVAGFGATLACDVARAGFSTDLLELVRRNDETGLQEWRERLQYELETNESGYFKKRHKTLKIPDKFPDRTLIGYYMEPAVSSEEDLTKLEGKLSKAWDREIDIPELRHYVGQTFDWLYKPGAWKFVRSMAPPLLAHKLRLGLAENYLTSIEQIIERRQHFVSDGMPELRMTAVPAEIVGLDLDAEEDSPEYLARLAEEQEQVEDVAEDGAEEEDDEGEAPSASQPARKQRKAPPWRPYDLEKMWISETIVQLGVPALFEEWQQHQRDMLADPKKYASRKCKKVAKAANASKDNQIKHYFAATKSAAPAENIHAGSQANPTREEAVEKVQEPATPTKKSKENATSPASPQIKNFFKVTKPAPRMNCLRALAGNARKGGLPDESILAISNEQPDPDDETSSKPAQPMAQPSTPRKAALQAGADEVIELPDSVTQRRGRTRKAKTQAVQAQPGTLKIRSKALESFFQAKEREEGTAPSMPLKAVSSAATALPVETGTGLQVDFIRKNIYAIPRESLPGTWKEIDLDEQVMSVKSKRTARISFVDLTED